MSNYKEIASYEMQPKTLNRAIAETSQAIKSGKDPEQAWIEWFAKNQKPKRNAFTHNDIKQCAETLMMEPSKTINIGKCSQETAKNRMHKIKAYMDVNGVTLFELMLDKQKDSTFTITLKNIAFDYKGPQKPHDLFAYESFEYKKLEYAANKIREGTERQILIENTYMDYGTKWRYTTLIEKTKDWGEIQILSPMEQTVILYGTKEQFEKIIQNLRNKKR